MATIGESEKIWLDYIVKLNDRLLDKQKTSGFTSYAVIFLMGLASYSILDKISSNQPFSLFNHLFIVSLCNSINACIAIVLAIAFFSALVSRKEGETRILPPSSYIHGVIIEILILVYLLFTILLNTYLIHFIHDLSIDKFPYKFFSGFAFLFALVLLFQKLSLRIKKRKLLKKIKKTQVEFPELSPSAAENTYQRNILFIMLLFAIAFTLVSLFSYFNIFTVTKILAKPFILKLSIEIVALYVFLFILVSRAISTSSQAFLYSLERKILTEGINSDEVCRLFVSEYLGQPTNQWLEVLREEIDNKFNSFMETVDNAQEQIDELKGFDKELAYEIKGRKEEICKSVKDSYWTYSHLIKERIAQIRHLVSRKAFAVSEDQSVEKVMSYWYKQLSVFRKDMISCAIRVCPLLPLQRLKTVINPRINISGH